MSSTFADVTDRARSVAVRMGHSEITALHLAQALASLGEPLEGIDDQTLAAELASLPVTFGNPEPDAACQALLDTAAKAPSPSIALREAVLADVAKRLQPRGSATESASAEPTPRQAQVTAPEAAPARPTTPSPAPGSSEPAAVSPDGKKPFTLPDRYSRLAEIVSPHESLLPRRSTVEQVSLALTGRYRRLAMVLGEEGSGRTSFAHLLVDQHGCVGDDGQPWPVVRVNGAICRRRPQDLEPLLRHCRDTAIVVIDDLEVLLALGTPPTSYSFEMASLLRSAVEDEGNRIVTIMNRDYLPALRSLDKELVDELEIVELEPFDDRSLGILADHMARDIGAFHSVEFPPALVEQALSWHRERNRSAVPGALARSLDRAAARARIAARGNVDAADFDQVRTIAAVPDPARLREHLATRVLGQEQAVDAVANIVCRTKALLDDRTERPDGVLLFAGPTGSGKTELARALAEGLYGSENALIRLDMSEFYSEHTIANLIGSPPGYVGSDSPDNWLTTRVRRRPESVLLLDEIEKAHPRVWNSFLQVFDAGRLTDSAQGEVDFSKVTIIATTNLGARSFDAKSVVGFLDNAPGANAVEREVVDVVKRAMNPELFNRFDAVLVFKPLGRDVISQIAARAVERVRVRAQARGWNLTVPPAVVDRLVELGYSPELGARELQRTVERELLDPLLVRQPGDYFVTLGEDGQLLVSEEPADGHASPSRAV